VSAEVTEVLTKGIETRRRGVSEVADLGSDLGDVPVGCAGQYPGGCGVLFGCAESPIDVFHGRLQCVNAPFEIILTHRVETTGAISAGVPLISGPVDKERRVLRIVMFGE